MHTHKCLNVRGTVARVMSHVLSLAEPRENGDNNNNNSNSNTYNNRLWGAPRRDCRRGAAKKSHDDLITPAMCSLLLLPISFLLAILKTLPTSSSVPLSLPSSSLPAACYRLRHHNICNSKI